MVASQKFIPAICFYIALCALSINGCKSPVGPIGFPESFEIDIEDTTTIAAEPDTASSPAKRKPLTLVFTNLAPAKSPVNVVFYQEKHQFLSKTDRLKGYKFTSNGNTLTVQIKNLGYGEYAIAFYQDVNSDGKCDKNFIGIPTEPYGFSNNFKPKLKAPRYKDCKFTFNENEDTLTMSMIR